MPADTHLEVAVFSGSMGLRAQQHGAQRIELNAPGSYAQGGLTPPLEELTSIASKLSIPVRVMIRPSGPPLGSDLEFMYSQEDFDQMKTSIQLFRDHGLMNPLRGDGFVFGVVQSREFRNSSGTAETRLCIDIERCKELVKLARPFPCVFHRAFDPVAAGLYAEQGLKDLITCGFEGLLTSGGPGPHANYLRNLQGIVLEAAGDIQIIVGGGVRAGNVRAALTMLAARPGAHAVWFHTACLAQDPPETIDHDELTNILLLMEVTEPV